MRSLRYSREAKVSLLFAMLLPNILMITMNKEGIPYEEMLKKLPLNWQMNFNKG
jgi:hypothetical protein